MLVEEHLMYKAGVNVIWLLITPTGKSLMTGLEYSLLFSLLRIDEETQNFFISRAQHREFLGTEISGFRGEYTGEAAACPGPLLRGLAD